MKYLLHFGSQLVAVFSHQGLLVELARQGSPGNNGDRTGGLGAHKFKKESKEKIDLRPSPFLPRLPLRWRGLNRAGHLLDHWAEVDRSNLGVLLRAVQDGQNPGLLGLLRLFTRVNVVFLKNTNKRKENKRKEKRDIQGQEKEKN